VCYTLLNRKGQGGASCYCRGLSYLPEGEARRVEAVPRPEVIQGVEELAASHPTTDISLLL
jgi:hypothetical protein